MGAHNNNAKLIMENKMVELWIDGESQERRGKVRENSACRFLDLHHALRRHHEALDEKHEALEKKMDLQDAKIDSLENNIYMSVGRMLTAQSQGNVKVMKELKHLDECVDSLRELIKHIDAQECTKLNTIEKLLTDKKDEVV